MFFTVFGYNSPRIKSASLDGTNRREVISEKIVYPVALTLDLANSFIYWIDTYLDVVEKAAYDGSRRKTVKKGRLVLFHLLLFFPFKIYYFRASGYGVICISFAS